MQGGKHKRSRVTLADVASRAGVSVTTVSLVLGGRTDARIPIATADRVRQAASVLNYTALPRPIPTGLGQLPIIGFITDTAASDHFVGEMIRGTIARAAERGHGLFTLETEGDRALEQRLITSLIDQGVERFIYAAMTTRSVQLPPVLQDRCVVLLNCIDSDGCQPSIVPDEQSAGALAASTLLDAGHGPRVWLVGEVHGQSYAGRERHRAIVDTLGKNGQRLARHVKCEWWPPASRIALTEALSSCQSDRLPSAIIAMNDRVAHGVYQAAAVSQLKIPEALSVISFDNSDLAWWLYPELTSIGLPYYGMGTRAVECVLAGDCPASPELLKMDLHERASVAMLPEHSGVVAGR